MKERPILFTGEMVRALLAGTKTQTRRAMSRQKQHDFTDYTLFGQQGHSDDDWVAIEHAPDWPDGKDDQCHCPYARRRGDRLWVREAWTFAGTLDPGILVYRADYPACVPDHYENIPPAEALKWRPSIHLARDQSRILLEVTELRVQRLQEISEEDAKAEGLSFVADGCARWGIDGIAASWSDCPITAYAALWDQINGAGSWALNPWVWAVSFRRVTA